MYYKAYHGVFFKLFVLLVNHGFLPQRTVGRHRLVACQLCHIYIAYSITLRYHYYDSNQTVTVIRTILKLAKEIMDVVSVVP